MRATMARLLCQEFRRREFFRRVYLQAAAHGAIDFVFLAYIDWALFAIAALGSPFGKTPFSGITMGLRFHFERMGVKAAPDPLGPVKDRLFRRLLAQPTLKNIFTIDETLPDYLAAEQVTRADKVVYFGDPAGGVASMTRAEARASLDVPEDACVVLAYGFLDARKGIDRLLRWVMGPVPSRLILVAVGNQSPDVQRLFEGPAAQAATAAGRIRTERRFVSDEEEQRYFRAADLVWLGYDRFDFMSAVVVRAAQNRLAIVYDDRGLVARFAEKHGVVPDPTDRCAPVYESVPGEMHVRHFNTGRPLPDHSWSGMKQQLLNPEHVRN